jgi:hypothetical protein
MGLVGGVLVLDAIFLAVGTALLAAHLRGRSWRSAVSYAGLAFLAGAGATGVALHVVVVFGARPTPVALGLVAAALAVGGLVAAWRRGPGAVASGETGARRERRPGWRDVLQVGAAGILLALLGLTVVAAFRTAPFLDDTWGIWVPRGLALDHVGLDARIFSSSFQFETLDHPDYPLWWSLIAGLDMRFIGSVDLRAMNAQTAIMVLAFFGAVARLLWGVVRPWLLWPGLLLLAASPELLRQTQSGGADLALAAYLGLFAIGAGLWLWRGDGLGLGIAFISAATALVVKSEGLPQVAILAVLAGIFGWRHARGRVGGLALALAGALVTALPWFVWRQTHNIKSLSDVPLGDALDPGYLLDRTERVGTAANKLAFHLTNPREWLIVVPLAVVASVYVAWRTRRFAWLAPAAVVLAGYAFWVWVNWADSMDLDLRLGTSAYRVIDAVVLIAGVSIPVLVERLIRHGPPGAAGR